MNCGKITLILLCALSTVSRLKESDESSINEVDAEKWLGGVHERPQQYAKDNMTIVALSIFSYGPAS